MILDAIKNRNSNALMSDEDIDTETIRQILDAAVCSPVHHQTNPWRFLVIRGAGRTKLGDIMADHAAKNMADPHSAECQKFLDNIRKKPLRAPVIIAAGAAKSDNKLAVMREDVASLAASCQNILLAASALDLNAIWRTGSFCYGEDTVTALGFAPETELVGFIYLGHPMPEKQQLLPEKQRPTSEEFTRWKEE